MRFTYKDLGELTDVPYHTLRQWKSFGYLGTDGDGAGTLKDPVTFNELTVTVIMWLSRLQRFNVELRQALEMLTEAARDGHTDVLLVTEDGYSWVSHKDAKRLFEDHPAYFAVSIPHFIATVDAKVAAFHRVKKMRAKIGLPTENVGQPMSLVH